MQLRLAVPRRIAVAEDDHEMLTLLVDALSADGHDVEALASGRELDEELRFRRAVCPDAMPDLVVSDVRMPGLGGLEVLERLRAAGEDLPVILITGFGDDETLNAAVRHRATMVLCKPFDLDHLRLAVFGLCDRQRPASELDPTSARLDER